LEFPYQLMNIESQGESFVLSAYHIDLGTPATKKYGILGASFSAVLAVSGIDAHIRCDFTLGNLFDFYNQLTKCYVELSGTAVLQDDSPHQNTMLKIYFVTKNGHANIDGKFVNRGTKNSIGFSFETDQTYIRSLVNTLKFFFDELTEMQGFSGFPY